MLPGEARELLTQGYERVHNAKEIAAAYGVSERTVYRLVRQKRETGSVAPRTSRCGRKSKLSEDDLHRLDEAIHNRPDATLRELREELDLDCSESNLSRIVRNKLHYTLKKKVIHASEQERPRCAGETRSMERIRSKR